MKTKALQLLLIFLLAMVGYNPVSAEDCSGNAPITVAPSMTATPGTVVVPIKVGGNDFTNINAISLKLKYDKNVLTYVSITAPNKPSAWSEPQYAGTIITGNTAELGISHTGPSNDGWALSNDQVLYEITFNYSGGSTALVWNFENENCQYATPGQVNGTGPGLYLCQSLRNYVSGFICDLPAPTVTCPGAISQCVDPVVNWVNYSNDIQEIHCATPPTSSGGYWVDNGPWVWQSFYPGKTGVLKSVSLGVWNINVLPFTLHIALYPGDGVCASAAPGTPPLWVYDTTFTSPVGPIAGAVSGVFTFNVPEAARPYMVAGQLYNFSFSGIHNYSGDNINDYTHGWYVSSPVCGGAGSADPMPGGGTYGYKPNGPTWTTGCVTNYHIAFNTVMGEIPGLTVGTGNSCGIKTLTCNYPSPYSFPLGTTNVIYTVTNMAGATSSCSFPVSINPLPVVADADMQYATAVAGPWTAMTETAPLHYAMCLDASVSWYYLDMLNLSSNPDIAADFLNPFNLVTGGLPSAWWDYWTAKGLTSRPVDPELWDIVHGAAPIFYIYKTGSDYQLIDGYLYLKYGLYTDLRVEGTYPPLAYTYNGTVKSVDGCVSSFFDVFMDFFTVPVPDDPADVVSCNSYTLPVLTVGNYYTGPGKTGTLLLAGASITATTTLYVYAETGTTPNCWAENSFLITINALPSVTDADMQYATAVAGPWSAMTKIAPLHYAMCLDASVSWYYMDLLNLSSTPDIEAGFLNPFKLATGGLPSAWWDYWTAKGLTSRSVDPELWDIVHGAEPIFYIYKTGSDYQMIDGYLYLKYGLYTNLRVEGTYPPLAYTYNGTVKSVDGCISSFFDVFMDFYTVPVPDAPGNVTACDSYTLPALTVGDYYTGPGKTGTMLAAGASVTASATLYVYAETGTTPNCWAENSFDITINYTPVPDAPADVTKCDSYTLPALTVGDYYTGPGKTGTMLLAGASITASTTLYVYAETGTTPNCWYENSFDITINYTPVPDAPANVTACDSYTLPALTVGDYYTGPGKTGILLLAGESITTTTTLYVYAETGTTPNCWAENSFVITINPSRSISGTIKYYNTPKTPLNNLTLALKQGPLTVATSLPTGSDGSYTFNNICPGIYTIEITNNNKIVGGINSTDAGAVNYWGAFAGEIEHVKFLAGDVATTLNFVSATDASRIQKYFVFGTPPFDRATWTYWKKGEKVLSNSNPSPIPTSFSVTVAGSNVANFDLYGMATGDFNGSFIPGSAKSASTSVQLLSENVMKIGADQSFDLALRTTSALEVGAVSLILNFPADLVEVKDVTLAGSDEKPDFSVNGNVLTIGWNSTMPVTTAAAGNLLVLSMRTTASFTEGKSIRLSLASDPLNELADGSSIVIPDVFLNTDFVINAPVGINDQKVGSALVMTNYPNPFTESTTLQYTLPVDGLVTIEIRDMVGQTVKTLVDKAQVSGTYKLTVDARTFSQGVYTATLRVHNENNELVKTIKLIVNK